MQGRHKYMQLKSNIRGAVGPGFLQAAIKSENYAKILDQFTKPSTQLHPGLHTGVPVGQATRGTLSAHAAAFPDGFFRHEFFIVLIESQILQASLLQAQNIRKGDFPMVFLPDPTTTASEYSSIH